MCGVTAEYSFEGLDVEPSLARARQRVALMEDRGPDAQQTAIIDRSAVLGHTRLAIIDLESSSNQPFSVGHLHISFNGEIYNYKQIRAEIIKTGEKFITQSDTEVILRGYKLWGAAVFSKLRGMFALVLYDSSVRAIVAARDSFGMKPLYYSVSGDRFSFCSSVRALSLTEECGRKDPVSELSFLWFGFVPEPKTIYSKISAVPAGHIVTIDSAGFTLSRMTNTLESIYLGQEYSKKRKLATGEDLNEVFTQIKESVEAHRIADVPIGLFLSAGIDSNLIAQASVAQEGNKLTALTLGFDEFKKTSMDESEIARETSSALGFNYHLHNTNFKEIDPQRKILIGKMDQPTIDGLNVFLLSKIASERGIKSSLMGTGADELFGGYSFFNFANPASLVRRNKMTASALGIIAGFFNSTKIKKLAERFFPINDLLDTYLLIRSLNLPSDLIKNFDISEMRIAYEFVRQNFSNEVNDVRVPSRVRLMYFDQTFYMKNQLLRDADWASMAHSLEIRCPFVDIKVLQSYLQICAKGAVVEKPRLARHCLSDNLHKVANRKKTGFDVPRTHASFGLETYKTEMKHEAEKILQNF